MAHEDNALRWAIDAFADKALGPRYTTYGRYLDGDHDLAFATPKYAATFGRMFEAFSYNRMSGVIDALADRLQVERFARMAEADASDDDDPAERRLAAIWDANRMDKRAGEVHKEAFAMGDAYVLVWPEPDRPEPTIWPQQAHQIRVQYDDEHPGRIEIAAKSWQTHDGQRRLNLYYRDRIEKYITRTKSPAGLPRSDRQLTPHLVEGEPWPAPNDYDTVPVFHFGNEADIGEMGKSELRDVMPLQDALNKTITDLLLSVELVAFAQKVIIGLDANDPNVKEGLLRIEAGLSKIITIPFGEGPTPKIDEFTAGNLTQVTEVVELFDKLISRVSRVPVHYLHMSGDFPSGRALRTAEAPFVAKIEDRQTAFGNVWEDAMTLALRMTGDEQPGRLRTVWKSAAPLSEEDAWDIALQKSAVGMPLEAILTDMGRDATEIGEIVRQVGNTFDVAVTGIGEPDEVVG